MKVPPTVKNLVGGINFISNSGNETILCIVILLWG